MTDLMTRIMSRDRALVEVATSRPTTDGDFRRVARMVTRVAAEVLGVERVGVWLFADRGRRLECVTNYRRARDEHAVEPSLDSAGYPAYFDALRTGRAIAASDARSDVRTRELDADYLEPNDIRSMLDAAIRVRGEVVGVVCHEHVGQAHEWQVDEICFASGLADQIAQAMLNAERQAQADDVRRLEDELEVTRRLEALGRLAGGVVHDLNNLLFIVLANAELLKLTNLGEAGKEQLQALQDAASRSAELAKRLLSFGSRTRGDVVCDARQVLADLIPLLRQVVPATVELAGELPEQSCPVRCSRGVIEQAVMNLVVNARDAVDGRGRIEARLTPSGAVEDAPIEGPAVRIAVSDDGPGVSDELASQVFVPFFSTKPRAQGSGLGLSTVKGLVESCGGTVRLERTEPGSTFALWLRAAAPGELSAAPHQACGTTSHEDAAMSSRGRVLIADSDPAARRALAELLRRQGFEVVAAGDGNEVVALFGALAEPPTVVVLDHALAVMDGRAALVAIRAQAPDVPVVVVGPQDAEVPEAEILSKPFGGDALREVIDRAVGAR